MKGAFKGAIIVAICLLLLGGGLFAGMMAMMNWDFLRLSDEDYQTIEYELEGAFGNISMDTDTADLFFLPAEGETCRVVCYEKKDDPHKVEVVEDTLQISAEKEDRFRFHWGISFKSPKITVYLPKKEYDTIFIKGSTGDIELPEDFDFESIDIALSTGDVRLGASASARIKIGTSTGKITMENASAGSLDLSVTTGRVSVSSVTCEGEMRVDLSTGDTSLSDSTCRSLTSTGSTGNISLKNVVARETIEITRSTGNVRFEDSDAAEITVKTDTGSIKGSLLSEKIFSAHSDTGKVVVPDTISGGRCTLTTDTGDIRITLK